MTYKIGDKLKLLTSFYEDEEYSQNVSKGSVLDVVKVCRTEGQWIDQTSVQLDFLCPPYNHDNEFEIVEEEKVKNRFAVGDKVISGKDASQNPEGTLGYVSVNDNTVMGGLYPYRVECGDKETAKVFSFKEDELELLSVGGKEIELPVKPTIYDTPKAESALDKQIGGGHYKEKGIQPIEYIFANNLGFCEANIVKYATRWKDKNGIQDLEKIIHYTELLIELTKKEELKGKDKE